MDKRFKYKLLRVTEGKKREGGRQEKERKERNEGGEGRNGGIQEKGKGVRE